MIPQLLHDLDKTLRFRISFDYVTMRLYGALLYEALKNGCVVGVGFDFGHHNERDLEVRHVCRISRQVDCRVVLIDDSQGSDAPEKIISWTDMETAVRLVDDGWNSWHLPSWIFKSVRLNVTPSYCLLKLCYFSKRRFLFPCNCKVP